MDSTLEFQCQGHFKIKVENCREQLRLGLSVYLEDVDCAFTVIIH